MAKKACRNCNMIFEGEKCHSCGGNDATDSFKGRVIIFNPEESEIAKRIKMGKKGTYAIKTR
jgi:DNA-directed RNA polymerase subunit E"